jgi:hypothetical protein
VQTIGILDGSLQLDLTPFSVYIAPRSSNSRFRPYEGMFGMRIDVRNSINIHSEHTP